MVQDIFSGKAETGTAILGRMLPSLLYEAHRNYPNDNALNQPVGDEWEAFSLERFKQASEESAMGLLDLGLQRGDRVALFMESDVYFCIADMGCLIAGLVDVPVYLTYAQESIQYVLNHSGARVLFTSSLAHLRKIESLLPRLPHLQCIVVAEMEESGEPLVVPTHIEIQSLDRMREKGRSRLEADHKALGGLLEAINPHDLATIIYTSGTTGQPKGVMLSHENISYNALTAFSGMSDYRPGAGGEVVISFLPLTHVFARSLHYGFLAYGSSVYFSKPETLSRDLGMVRPTIFASVPRVLEKVYTRIREKTTQLTGIKRFLLVWALRLAASYRIGEPIGGWRRLQLKAADRLVFKKWRAALGGRVKYIISGGAALSADLTNIFGAAGVTILQGYGLTETSPVIAFNRPGRNRPGTVGEPLPGLEIRTASDGEILTRGPHVMKGYFKDEFMTREVIDTEGWLHTGDIGEISPDGYLRITDRKKDLFKLSTGKYVIPQVLESRLVMEPLVEQAVIVGTDHKFCAALLFPEQDALKALARSLDLDAGEGVGALVCRPEIKARYQELIERANEGIDPWSTIKRFRLIPDQVTIESGLLTPTMKLRRAQLRTRYAAEIEAMYAEADNDTGHDMADLAPSVH